MNDKNKLLEEFIYCACNCGKTLPKYDERGRKHIFIKGHHRRNKRSGCWKGGRCIDNKGYVQLYIPDYHKTRKGYVSEHRYVYEQYYKLCLLSWGLIHHINEDRKDNRIENLQGMMKKDHIKIHINHK